MHSISEVLLLFCAATENESKVLEEACLALCRLGMVQENAVSIVTEGGVKTILAAMKENIASAGVQVRTISVGSVSACLYH